MAAGSQSRTGGKEAKILPPRQNKALVWSFVVILPLLVGVLVYLAEPPMVLTDLGMWIAVVLWVVVAVVVCAALGGTRSGLRGQLPVLLLVAFMLVVGQLAQAALTPSSAASSIVATFWAFFLGLAVYGVFFVTRARRLSYCPTCGRYWWMVRKHDGFECPGCKTLQPFTRGG